MQDTAELGKERFSALGRVAAYPGGLCSPIPSPRPTVQVRDGKGWGSVPVGTNK